MPGIYGETACPCNGDGHPSPTPCLACGASWGAHYNHSCPGAADRSADTFRPAPPVACSTCLCDCAQCTCEDAYCWRCGCGDDPDPEPDPECEDCGCECDGCGCDYDGCGSCGCGVPDDDDETYGCTCENCEANDDYIRASLARRGLVT